MPGGKPGNMPGATGEETKEILTNPVKGSKYGFRRKTMKISGLVSKTPEDVIVTKVVHIAALSS